MTRPLDFPKECQRCGATPLKVTSMSRFNTDHLCETCLKLEQQHPDFAAARDAEHEAVVRGDYNFPGIGCPADLVDASRRARAVPA